MINDNTTVYARLILAGKGSITLSFSGLLQDETTDLIGNSGNSVADEWNHQLDASPPKNFQGRPINGLQTNSTGQQKLVPV